MKTNKFFTFILVSMFLFTLPMAHAQKKTAADLKGSKPNIIVITSDDTGWGDWSAYGGGPSRGINDPNIDRLDKQGMQFWNYYGQASCTAGRAAMQTGRFPNRSGMTTVAFQGSGGGLPAAEWTVAEVLKKAGYQTFFSGKWHLGESDYALPNAQGYDIMKNVVLYHLNAYTYTMPSWHPSMDPEQLAFFQKVTTGILEGTADSPAKEVSKVTKDNIAELDMMMMENVLPQLDEYAKSGKPFFMDINFAKNHQPNLPSKKFKGQSPGKSDYTDACDELDYNIGRILDEIEKLGISENTLILYNVDNGAWQDVYPDCGYTPFRGNKGTVREGGFRVPAFAVWKSVIKPGSDNFDITGGLDMMATFAYLAGVDLPTKDQEGKPTTFDSYNMTPLLTGENDKYERKEWIYFTEQDVTPGAIRVGRWKFVLDIRGDNGAQAGNSDVPGKRLGWTGPKMEVATVPEVYDMWADPQERYDVFMTSFEENTWTGVMYGKYMNKIIESYIKYPPRPMQSVAFGGSLSITRFLQLQEINKALHKSGYKGKITE